MNAASPGILAVDARCITLGLSTATPDAVVIAASSNTDLYWNMPPEQVVGRRICELVLCEEEGGAYAVKHGRSEPHVVRDMQGHKWFLFVTTCDGQTMAHLEPARDGAEDREDLRWFAAAMADVMMADNPLELLERGCEHVRHRVGADRTFAILVDAGQAEVVAESLAKHARSFARHAIDPSTLGDFGVLGLGATPSVSVFDLDADGSRMVPERDHADRPWNLSGAPHRHLSDLQRAAVRWADARSCFVLSLRPGAGDQAYAIVSLSQAPLAVDAFARLSCEILAQLMTVRLESLRQSAELDRRLTQVRLLPDLASRTRPLIESLTAKSDDGQHLLLQIVPADGSIIHLDGGYTVVGDVAAHEAEALIEAGACSGHPQPLGFHAIADLAQADPDLSARIPDIGGIQCTPIGSDGSYICWIRRRRSMLRPRLVKLDSRTGPPVALQQQSSRLSAPWRDEDQRGAEMLAVVIDDWLLRAADSRLAELALTDPLTALPNRRLLVDRISQSILRQQRGQRFLLCFIDLNDFKEINDADGHRAGDNLLIAIADRLTSCVRPGDTVVRLGGDEFVVLCDDVQPSDAAAIEARITGCFNAPFQVDGRPLRISAAVGTTLATEDDTVESLLDRADSAMYTSKSVMKSR